MEIKGLFRSIDISAAGLSAQRQRTNVIASNIANVHTTQTKSGGPYRRQMALLRQKRPSRDFRSLMGRRSSRLVATHRAHSRGGLSRGMRRSLGGVEVAKIAEEAASPRMVFDPGHPDADARGYVAFPNINIVTEMVNMISATRAYEANVTALNAAKSMAQKALEI